MIQNPSNFCESLSLTSKYSPYIHYKITCSKIKRYVKSLPLHDGLLVAKNITKPVEVALCITADVMLILSKGSWPAYWIADDLPIKNKKIEVE